MRTTSGDTPEMATRGACRGLEETNKIQLRSKNEEGGYSDVLCAVLGVKEVMVEIFRAIERSNKTVVLVGKLVRSASAAVEALPAKVLGVVSNAHASTP